MADSNNGSGGSCLEKILAYAKTQKGTILAAEALISFIVIICYAASYYGAYSAAAISELVFSSLFFFIFMMELDKQFLVINWLWTDLFRAIIGTAVYLITSLLCVVRASGDGALIAGGIIGLLAGLLFAYDCYTIVLVIKSTKQQLGVTHGGGV